MSDENDLSEIVDFFFTHAALQFGDAFDSFWFYENETCPCCNKNKIGVFNIGKDPKLSLNMYIYRELNVLIGYFLCHRCITDLPAINKKKQKMMYDKLEQTLKNAYLNAMKETAS